jgi:hypothetical protein
LFAERRRGIGARSLEVATNDQGPAAFIAGSGAPHMSPSNMVSLAAAMQFCLAVATAV